MKSNGIVLKFSNFQVDEIEYCVNKNFNKEIISKRSPRISYEIIKSEQIHKFNIVIGAIYNEDNNLPFLLNVKIRGFFETSEELKEEESLEIVVSNGSAILFPYLRSLITDITSKSNFSPIIIPTINFSEIIHNDFKNNKEKHLLSSEYYEEPII